MVTEKTKEKLKKLLKDIRIDCNNGFTGQYKISFNDGGLTRVTRKESKNYS